VVDLRLNGSLPFTRYKLKLTSFDQFGSFPKILWNVMIPQAKVSRQELTTDYRTQYFIFVFGCSNSEIYLKIKIETMIS
jgi:hypothetical protein